MQKKSQGGVGIGVALGAALGAALGVAAGHLAVWLAIGVAIGLAVGGVLRRSDDVCSECAAAHRDHQSGSLKQEHLGSSSFTQSAENTTRN